MSGQRYEARYSPDFESKKNSRALRPHLQLLQRTCEKLIKNPCGAARSHRLAHDLAGLRAADVTNTLRVIFKVCEECRRRGDHELNPLDCCELGGTEDLTITFLDIDYFH
jgi:mRNA-degrading endonuclease YafQ of YafQ-DinJ toxin-antitoxin module